MYYSSAIKAFEPSMTEKDIFIGLNAEGRLINVEEENTVLQEQCHIHGRGHSQVIKIGNDELLPLSMFLKAVGSTVRVSTCNMLRYIRDAGLD